MKTIWAFLLTRFSQDITCHSEELRCVFAFVLQVIVKYVCNTNSSSLEIKPCSTTLASPSELRQYYMNKPVD